jgi:Tfp pilus assembly protein PilO
MTLTIGHQMKVAITVVAMIAVVAGGWLLGIQPSLDAASAAGAQRDAVYGQNDAIRAEIAALQTAQEDLPDLEDRLRVLNASVPTTNDSSALIDSLHQLAARAGVRVDGVTFEDGQPYAAPLPPEAAPVEPAAEGAAAETVPVEVPVEVPVDPLMPLTDPSITAENFVLVPLTVAVSGSFGDVLRFVDGVQSGPRLFLVNKFTSSSEAATGGGSSVKATVGGFVFVLLGEGTDAP